MTEKDRAGAGSRMPQATPADRMDPAAIRRRAGELGLELHADPRVFSDTSNYLQIDRGDVLDLGGALYLVVGNEREGRFGIDEQPKYWVKRALGIPGGEDYVVKLVFEESFTTQVAGQAFECKRSATKEADILQAVRDHPNFMHGRGVVDAAGNLVRVIDYIRGETLLGYFGGLGGLAHEEYTQRLLPHMLAKAWHCFAGIAFLHERGFCHGDIRNDHVMLDDATGQARWIDFDFTRPSLAFDVWSMGNVLNCVVAKGFVTFHNLNLSHPELLAKVDSLDASVFFPHRVMNVDKLYPWIPARLAPLLRRFSASGMRHYERVDQVLSDLGECMDALGWKR
jgi:serine/threonine protein kinase